MYINTAYSIGSKSSAYRKSIVVARYIWKQMNVAKNYQWLVTKNYHCSQAVIGELCFVSYRWLANSIMSTIININYWTFVFTFLLCKGIWFLSFLPHINKKPVSLSLVAPHIMNFHAADSGVISLAGQIDSTLKYLLQTYIIKLSVCSTIVSRSLTKEYVWIIWLLLYVVFNIINALKLCHTIININCSVFCTILY